MIEVELSKIIIDEDKKEQIVVLKEKHGLRVIPIVIGMHEAVAIQMGLGGFTPPRPLTHDLMKSFLDTLNVRLERVVIDKLVQGTFHAKLYLAFPGKDTILIDARPSDSVALAVRTKSPLFAAQQVFSRAQTEK